MAQDSSLPIFYQRRRELEGQNRVIENYAQAIRDIAYYVALETTLFTLHVSNLNPEGSSCKLTILWLNVFQNKNGRGKLEFKATPAKHCKSTQLL